MRTMNYGLAISDKRPAVAMVALLTLALLFCLVHTCLLPSHHGEASDVDMLHGICAGALTVGFLASSLVFLPMSWWLLAGLEAAPSPASLHLPDPPPKSPALL